MTAFARNEKVTRLFVQEWQCCLTLNKPQFAVLDLGQKWVTWELALNPAVKMQNAPVTWRATELCAVARLLLFTMAPVFISFWNLQEQLNFFITGDLVQCSKAHALSAHTLSIDCCSNLPQAYLQTWGFLSFLIHPGSPQPLNDTSSCLQVSTRAPINLRLWAALVISGSSLAVMVKKLWLFAQGLAVFLL